MTQRAYEVFEHTADIALHAFGSAVAAALPLPAFPPRSVQKDDAHPTSRLCYNLYRAIDGTIFLVSAVVVCSLSCS